MGRWHARGVQGSHSAARGAGPNLAGLPGDEEHGKLFARYGETVADWLTGPLGFKPANVRVLSSGAKRQLERPGHPCRD